MKKMSLLISVFALVLTSLMVLPAIASDHATMVAETDSADTHLVDSKGMTLYWFTKDSIGQSVCSGECVAKWPIYYREKVEPAAGTTAADYDVIVRGDGQKQTTFRGYPLYYFFKDKMAGDNKGQGVKDVWFMVNPAKFPHS